MAFPWPVSDHVRRAGIANESQGSSEGSSESQDQERELNIPFPPPQLFCSQLAASLLTIKQQSSGTCELFSLGSMAGHMGMVQSYAQEVWTAH